MKKERAVFYKFAIGFAGMVITLWACKDNISDAGLNLLPKSDLVKVSQVVEKSSIKAYTEVDGNQRTDRPTFNLLGTFNDSIFGNTSASFACQLRLNSFPKYKKNDHLDSLVYFVAYKEIYGDKVTPQKFKVYELASSLVYDNKYYQDVDLKALANPIPVCEYQYIPKFKLDSLSTTYGSTKADPKDTVNQEISFKLNNSLGLKLMAADSATLSDNDLFLQYFKGLYVEAEDLGSGGTIMKSTGSGMILYFHKDNDTTKYTQTFYVTSSSARVSHFHHDYSKTSFAADLDNPETPDSLIYLQTTGGLRSKILIPDLGNWSDSTNIAINGAELVLQIDTTVTNVYKYLPPPQLVFSAIGLDTLGNVIKYLPSDVSFSQTYYGGTYNSTDKTYRFNIVKHMQDIILKKKGKENMGFYLSTSLPSSSYRRVVLKGPSSKTGIKLKITYSKIK